MSELEVRRASRADVPAIVDLLEEALGPGEAPRTAEFWNWKHVDNPFGESPALVATRDGRIGALRAFMRWNWDVDGERVPAVRAVDTVTHPDFRRQGLFRRLTLQLVEEMREEGVAFVFNTPNRYSRPGYLKMGWEMAGRVAVLVRPCRLAGLARCLGLGSPAPAPNLSGFPTIDEAPHEVLEEVAASREDAHAYQTSRTPAYLIWRYQRVPEIRYHALWKRAPEPALVIFRGRVRRGMSEVTVTEVLGNPSAAAGLLRRLARVAGVDHLAASASRRTRARRALLGAGHVPVPRAGATLTVLPLQGRSDPDPSRMDSWRLSLGDIELF